jgi:hypothetical protein
MKANQDGHNFAQTQTPRTLSLFQAVTQELAFPLRLKALAKIIDVPEQVF